ncbi:MAG: RNA-binding cell elongation regulator Jag/EloR [Clostridia bacterium]|nr:RNA-binding cell elongation regulator Jag/EloR [Clostridia bacterium]
MPRKIEKSAKSKEEALKLAAEEFGVAPEELSCTVERESGKGLMGFLLGKEVVISAWITKEAEEEERKIKESAMKRASSEKVAAGENPYAPKSEPTARDLAPEERKHKKPYTAETAKAPAAEKTPVSENPSEPEAKAAAEVSAAEKRAPRKNREVTEKSIEDAKYFATELVHKMGLADAQVTAENGGVCINVDVSGGRMGLLIGKRGETLNAVQYLTSLYVNKAKNSYIKVNVDTENYRLKREETLVKLAKSLERRVARDGESVTLEPMSPNERRIIHAALQDSAEVRTFSIGEEPNRKVVVSLKQ